MEQKLTETVIFSEDEAVHFAFILKIIATSKIATKFTRKDLELFNRMEKQFSKYYCN